MEPHDGLGRTAKLQYLGRERRGHPLRKCQHGRSERCFRCQRLGNTMLITPKASAGEGLPATPSCIIASEHRRPRAKSVLLTTHIPWSPIPFIAKATANASNPPHGHELHRGAAHLLPGPETWPTHCFIYQPIMKLVHANHRQSAGWHIQPSARRERAS